MAASNNHDCSLCAFGDVGLTWRGHVLHAKVIRPDLGDSGEHCVDKVIAVRLGLDSQHDLDERRGVLVIDPDRTARNREIGPFLGRRVEATTWIVADRLFAETAFGGEFEVEVCGSKKGQGEEGPRVR